LQLQAIQTGHGNIEYETAMRLRIMFLKKLLWRIKTFNNEAGRAEQPSQAGKHGPIIVNYENRLGFVAHAGASTVTGNVK
jgi:hypothetical protein